MLGHSSTTKVFQPAHLYCKREFKILGYHFDHLYVNLSLICSYNLPYGTTQHTQANEKLLAKFVLSQHSL